MGFPLYLAMTAAEINLCEKLPQNLAYMACHFSAYGTGLSNFPAELPADTLLILNDRTPVCGHDPALVAAQLKQAAEEFSCCGLLLDLQRPGNPETGQVVAAILATMPGFVTVSEHYARDRDCPIFLPPPPLRMPLEDYLQPWQGRDIWLEAAPDAETVAITKDGCSTTPLPLFYVPENSLVDEKLYCRYQIHLEEDRATFHIERSGPLLQQMLNKAQSLGVSHGVGLYQLLKE